MNNSPAKVLEKASVEASSKASIQTSIEARCVENRCATTVPQTVHLLSFEWAGPEPEPGQFFMLHRLHSSVFLPRPISYTFFSEGILHFLVALKGRGTAELLDLRAGQRCLITGPLGRGFTTVMPPELLQGAAPIALVGGGTGCAPLISFYYYLQGRGRGVELFTGFKSALKTELDALLPPDTRVVTEDGSVGEKGFVSDYVKSENYCALVSCGPEALLKALGRRAGETPCFVSLESKMACGMGACMGCTIETKQGNKRCCKDSQIYDIRELPWD